MNKILLPKSELASSTIAYYYYPTSEGYEADWEEAKAYCKFMEANGLINAYIKNNDASESLAYVLIDFKTKKEMLEQFDKVELLTKQFIKEYFLNK